MKYEFISCILKLNVASMVTKKKCLADFKMAKLGIQKKNVSIFHLLQNMFLSYFASNPTLFFSAYLLRSHTPKGH